MSTRRMKLRVQRRLRSYHFLILILVAAVSLPPLEVEAVWFGLTAPTHPLVNQASAFTSSVFLKMNVIPKTLH